MSDLSSILVHSRCVSKSQLLAYIQQKLDQEENYLVESHINDCQFCNDALDALMEADHIETEKNLADAKQQLTDKLFPKVEVASKVPVKEAAIREFEVSKKTFTRWLAAASILLLIGFGGYTVFSYIHSNKQEIALKEKEKGDTGYNAEYSKSEDAHDEIVRLKVQENDTFRKYAEGTDTKTSRAPESPVAAANKNVTVEEDLVYDKSPAASVALKDDAEKEAITEASKIPVPAAPESFNGKIDPAPGMENYSRESKDEKIQIASTKEVAKKKSAGGMRYDNNLNQNNQLNYPKANVQMDNVQRNAEQETVQKPVNEAYKEAEMSQFEKGMDLFNRKDYKKSISHFEKALKKAKGIEREDILYHLALAYEYTGKTEKANEIYASLSNSKKYSENADRKLKQARSKK